MPEFKYHRQILAALKDLERLGVVDAARRTQRPTFQTGIVLSPGREVFLFLLEGRGKVGDDVARHDAGARRRILTRRMRLKIEVGGTGRLPDSGDIRFA